MKASQNAQLLEKRDEARPFLHAVKRVQACSSPCPLAENVVLDGDAWRGRWFEGEFGLREIFYPVFYIVVELELFRQSYTEYYT
jgi:hypothetical protein